MGMRHSPWISMSEAAFQRNSKELSNFLTHPDMAGVYELQLPLIFRAIMKIGCVARVTQQAARVRRRAKRTDEDSKRPFQLDELEFMTTAAQSYLDKRDAGAKFRRVYFYHSKSDRRSTVALFIDDA